LLPTVFYSDNCYLLILAVLLQLSYHSCSMLLQQFKAYIATHHLFQPTDGLLLAVSGGLDSAVLCALCKQAGYNFVIAHCNFQLRGEESERDEQFVRSLGEKYGVEVLVKRFDTLQVAATQKKSIETTARDLRYQWFYELIENKHFVKNGTQPVNTSTSQPVNFILTAHHADDNIETATMNFFRGTGIAGIRGILPKQGKVIRPLLFAVRRELEDFAVKGHVTFVTDSTNAANDYTRNLFRNSILPMVNEAYPEAYQNILNNIHRFAETEILYQQGIALHKKKLLVKKNNEIHIPVLKLLQTIPLQTVLFEIIREFGFTAHQSAEAMALLHSETGKYTQSATHRIIKNRQWLIITPNQTTAAQNILIEENDTTVQFSCGRLKIEKLPIVNYQLSIVNSVAQLDAAEIKFPLLLRKWKQGDYFYPLGMKKKKKLSRFFTDQKLSLVEKENAWVIEMDKKIIWITGMRIDNRFKIGPGTKQVLRIECFRNADG